MKGRRVLSRNYKVGRRQEFLIGDVYMMRFDGVGSEQGGLRPGLIIQNNVGNKYSPNVIALPLTTCLKKVDQPTHVVVYAESTGLFKDSMVLCENPERMSKDRIEKYITSFPECIMRDVAIGFMIATSIVSFLDDDELLKLRQRALRLNAAG